MSTNSAKKEKERLQIPLEPWNTDRYKLFYIQMTQFICYLLESSVSTKRLEIVTLDGFDQGVIRRTIKNMYVEWRIPPTLTNITTALQESIGYSGSREHSRMYLKRIGFSYKKCESNRKETIKKNMKKK